MMMMMMMTIMMLITVIPISKYSITSLLDIEQQYIPVSGSLHIQAQQPPASIVYPSAHALQPLVLVTPVDVVVYPAGQAVHAKSDVLPVFIL